MAKGTLHLNVEFSAVMDEEGKFGRLATLLGLADADHARGKCEHLWVACTRRGEADLPQWLVEQLLGERGPEALIEAELASWGSGRGDSKTRRLRIGGAAKHCMWMASDEGARTEQRRKGGKAQAAKSSRQLDGTFAPAGDRHPAAHPAAASSSEISSASELPEDQNLPPARAIPPSTEPAPLPGERQEARQLLRELEQARSDAAAELGVEVLPLTFGDPGERDLADLFAAARAGGPAEVDKLVRQVRHAIAMAKAETVSREKPFDWFTGAVFSRNNFRRLAGKTAVPTTRAGPRSSAERAQPETVRKIKTL